MYTVLPTIHIYITQSDQFETFAYILYSTMYDTNKGDLNVS